MKIHENIRLEDPDRVFAAAGAMEAMLAAKQAGKIRFIGFTGHKDLLVHLRILEVAKEHGFHSDAAQMPLNVMDAHFRSFEKNVLPLLVLHGIGDLGMKPFASGHILKSNTVNAIECLHYTLNLPTSTVITGIDTMKMLDQAFEAVRPFEPMNQEAVSALLARTAESAAKGEFERFRTASDFYGTAHNPKWLG